MRNWSADHIVLISEEAAPDDFECIWGKSVSRSIKSTDKSKSTEKLLNIKYDKKRRIKVNIYKYIKRDGLMPYRGDNNRYSLTRVFERNR